MEEQQERQQGEKSELINYPISRTEAHSSLRVQCDSCCREYGGDDGCGGGGCTWTWLDFLYPSRNWDCNIRCCPEMRHWSCCTLMANNFHRWTLWLRDARCWYLI